MMAITRDERQQVLVRMWGEGNPCALLVGMETGVATVGSSLVIPQKIKNRTMYSDPEGSDAEYSFLSMCLKKIKIESQRNMRT